LNGAGKTTCLRILTGFIMPTGGDCYIDGINVFDRPRDAKARIGYLPEQPPLYQELTVQDYLQFVARMRGGVEDFEQEFLRVTKLTWLEPARRSLIRHLSLGYRKRVGIAQALIGSPPVLIFDEPISGLDPIQIVEIRNLIRSLAEQYTILISSHNLSEVSKTCDRVLIIHRGQMAGDLSGDEMHANLEDRFLELTAAPVTEVGQ
ncbi:MAG: ABC transporter ATP-binding protein, partial [Leptospiraceae bacterium]|nr:ABC transporter ATP-binding protein [Leptospiraceae bacterium]